jgi:hypothetical protein
MKKFNSPCGSPCGGFQIQSCLSDLPRTPPRRLFQGEEDAYTASVVDEQSSPLKMRMIDGGASLPISRPPEAPRKRTKNRIGPIEGLSVLPHDFGSKIVGDLGEGSFGKVFRVRFPGDDTSSYAMKVVEVVPGGRSSPIDLRIEASNYGSPKCNFGFGMSSLDGRKYFGFSCIAEPLDKALITSKNIDKIDNMARNAIMSGKFSVVVDANLGNIGIVRAGTPTPILGVDGLPCAGFRVENDDVLFIDLGENSGPNDCNGKYGALFDEGAMDSEEAQLKYRKFKCDVVSALLRNRLLAEPRNEYDIVREICNSDTYRYTYAAGDRR